MTIETAPAPDPFEHDCEEEAISVCCGSPVFNETDCCDSCHDHTTFECGFCGTELTS